METDAQQSAQWPEEVTARLRIAVVLFMVVLLISVVATITYLANRVGSRAEAAAASPSFGRSDIGEAGKPEPPIPAPEETAQPPAQESRSDQGTPAMSPGANRLYFQVAATTFAMAQETTRKLERLGLTVLVVPGPTEQIVRVLTGPLSTPQEMAETQALLSAQGYPFFLRSYGKTLPAAVTRQP